MKAKGYRSKLFEFYLFLLIGLISCNSKVAEIDYSNLILVCGDSKVLLVEYPEGNDSVPKIVWHWDAHFANDLPFEYRTRKFNSIDDCKPTPDGKQLMVSSSSGAVAVIDIIDRTVCFLADVPNAHSIELLPDNKIVVAASLSPKGNRLMLFENTQPAQLLDMDTLYFAHGVVWDEKRNSLYALGYDILREYKIQNGKELQLHTEWKLPGAGGHDLQFHPDKNHLFITEHDGAWIFNIDQVEFKKIADFPDAANIKSLNLNNSGQFVYTVPEESWWTYHVNFHNPTGKLSFPNMKVYKARIF